MDPWQVAGVMNTSFVIVLVLVLAGVIVVGSLVLARKSRGPRLLMAGLLVPVLLFSGFGFLASFEPAETGTHLPWTIGYAGLGATCLFGIGRLLISKTTNPETIDGPGR